MRKKEKSKDLKIVSILFAMFVIFSCKNDNKNKEGIINSNKSKVEYSFDLPDTLIVGYKYKGIINYKSVIDSVDTERFIHYYYHLTNRLEDISKIQKKLLDTFVGVTNNQILMYDIKFNSPGTFYIDGIVEDEYFLPKNEEEVILRKDESRLTYKVTVLDSTNTILMDHPPKQL